MSMSTVAVVTCWALLLLTMFPMSSIGARHVPAPPVQVTSTPQVVQDVPPSARIGLHDSRFRDAPRLTSTSTRQVGSNDVRSWRDKATTTASTTSKWDSIFGHRLLVGSSPPTCQGKCGACYPCNPIHVSIGSPHGALTQQEYYPEVWRCKCGNKLFMP